MEVFRPTLQLTTRATCRCLPWHQRRTLHDSIRCAATALPHGTIPGPPPPPPNGPQPPTAEDTIARKKRQAELLAQGRAVKSNSSKPGSALKRRFWKESNVAESDDGLRIMLDTRPVRTADREILTLPKSKQNLATAIALEWDQLVSAQQALKHHYIPLTSLASRAIDIRNADAEGNTRVRDDIVKMVMRYLTTDTLLCWAGEDTVHEQMRNEEGVTLREKQKKVAEEIVGYLTTNVWPGIEIKPALEPGSIMPASQPEMTLEVIRGWVSGLPAFELAGLERAVLASKSLLIASRLLVEWSQEFKNSRVPGQKRFDIEEALRASTLEVRWQTDIWGEVDDTHDVDKEDARRQLGSVILLVDGHT